MATETTKKEGSYPDPVKSIEATPEGVVCVLEGDLDVMSAAAVQSVLVEAARKSGKTALILDMTKLDFMDSAGLALLIFLYKSTDIVSSVHLKAAAKSQPERVLKIGCFDRLMTLDVV
jgi:anti-anti-sigma factor